MHTSPPYLSLAPSGIGGIIAPGGHTGILTLVTLWGTQACYSWNCVYGGQTVGVAVFLNSQVSHAQGDAAALAARCGWQRCGRQRWVAEVVARFSGEMWSNGVCVARGRSEDGGGGLRQKTDHSPSRHLCTPIVLCRASFQASVGGWGGEGGWGGRPPRLARTVPPLTIRGDARTVTAHHDSW